MTLCRWWALLQHFSSESEMHQNVPFKETKLRYNTETKFHYGSLCAASRKKQNKKRLCDSPVRRDTDYFPVNKESYLVNLHAFLPF